jgi:SOS response regulatory protein OraA/RecX
MARAVRIDTEEEAYQHAVGLLARKARTSAEVASDLAARGAVDEVVESVLGRLKSHRHLDDAAYAFDAAGALLDGKGMAPEAAVATLVERGISAAVARDAIEAVREGRSEGELCRSALERRLRGRTLEASMTGKEGRALARLGWDEEVVLRALERAAREAP